MRDFNGKFSYFLPNIPLSESNYTMLYGKSAEKGRFFPLFWQFCVIDRKKGQKAPRKRQKTLRKMEKSPQKTGKKLDPWKVGGE